MAHEERSLTYKQGNLEVTLWADYRVERLGYSLGARIKSPAGVRYLDRHNVSQDPPSIGQFFELASLLVDQETKAIR